ncbi:3-oxoacyl-ACP synthase [Mucilaginibacter rubeus]|uniref:3-oxoacyl-ACP synthase n=1 Tax=Mucilaginibacter rubeus TaxID=2027860 RepID=A0AAE6MKK0_9SPHI|nr:MULTISPECIES: 3-oxoacyl-ACP synthase [Mucilaginibacter]QEM06741.1 3-oxoacyl-ACP synthase [Mucilaginibacter rubeus]QEM19329.1 3-oxoacyl-ACP synthase [Mucilaginibacter gossypii]QTE44126.1 hypothetical protein J3L19_01710 [Mucilaginibacter rubeus]QTE50727.1 hypothetical protein J3L21_01690 [Mucilaginibacter rubeus]QTE55809.1 hypothetical protein J3L23_26925 [Mucilaginibacter rubeus]
MNNQYYISSHCTISSNAVHYNGTLLFEAEYTDVPGFLLSAYQLIGAKYPKFYKMDNLAKLGWLAAEVLLKDFDKEKYQPTDIGVVLINASSSIDADKRYYDSVQEIASPALFVYTLPNIVIGEICIRHHFKGENAFYIFEHFNADFISSYVSNLLETEQLQACICGWTEMTATGYKAVLFLIEKAGAIHFSTETVKMVYDSLPLVLTNGKKG